MSSSPQTRRRTSASSSSTLPLTVRYNSPATASQSAPATMSQAVRLRKIFHPKLLYKAHACYYPDIK